MNKKSDRLQFSREELEAEPNTNASEQPGNQEPNSSRKENRAFHTKASEKRGSKKLKQDEERSAERTAQLRFGKQTGREPPDGSGAIRKNLLKKQSSVSRAVKNSAEILTETAVHTGINHANEDDNVAVNAVESVSEAAEGTEKIVSEAGYSRKMRQISKKDPFDQNNTGKLSMNTARHDNPSHTDSGRGTNRKGNSNPISRWQQKRKIRKDYQTARRTEILQGTRGAASASGSAGRAAGSGKSLIENLKNFPVNHSGFLKIFLLILLILVLIVSGLQSCTTMFTGTLSTVTASSWPADDIEITKAEAYYVKMECELKKKIDKALQDKSGTVEVDCNTEDIHHDPSVLISYLCAKYGDFTFKEIQSDIKALFNRQYKFSEDEANENKTVTKKVTKGESLGNVVTTGYCNCSICCGKWAGGRTAAGVYPTANHTIAVDSSNPVVPMGTQIIMNGVLYTVEDTGPLAKYGVSFDVFYDSHSAASAHGEQTWEAFYAGGSGEEVEVTVTNSTDITKITLTTEDLETLCTSGLSEEENEMYDVYQLTHGNRIFFASPVEYNWHNNVLNSYGYLYNAADQKVETSDEMVLSLPEGSEVQSVMDGTVQSASNSKVVLEDKYGYEITFSGLKDISVQKGDEVTEEQAIGAVSSGTKLSVHFKYKDTELNPYFYMDTGTEEIASPGIASEKAAAVIAEARKHLGTPYVWGGYDPSGFDCSGFVSYCLNHSGVMNIGRQTCATLLPMCTQIQKSELQPGDLVFFQGTYIAGLSHVGIYIGSGEYGTGTFIHCGDPCQYADLNNQWWIDHWLVGGRILT